MERAKGIEPSCEAWKASVLPLNYARLRAIALWRGKPAVNLPRSNHTARICLVNPPRKKQKLFR